MRRGQSEKALGSRCRPEELLEVCSGIFETIKASVASASRAVSTNKVIHISGNVSSAVIYSPAKHFRNLSHMQTENSNNIEKPISCIAGCFLLRAELALSVCLLFNEICTFVCRSEFADCVAQSSRNPLVTPDSESAEYAERGPPLQDLIAPSRRAPEMEGPRAL